MLPLAPCPVYCQFSFVIYFCSFQFNSVQLLSRVQLCNPRDYIPQSLLKPMSIELVMPSNHLIVCHPLLLPPSIFPSIRVFPSESVLHIRWPKYWSFSFIISPSNEHSGLISFGMDWLDLLAVQRTLKSLLQHHSSLHLFLPFCTVWLCSTIIIVWICSAVMKSDLLRHWGLSDLRMKLCQFPWGAGRHPIFWPEEECLCGVQAREEGRGDSWRKSRRFSFTPTQSSAGEPQSQPSPVELLWWEQCPVFHICRVTASLMWL